MVCGNGWNGRHILNNSFGAAVLLTLAEPGLQRGWRRAPLVKARLGALPCPGTFNSSVLNGVWICQSSEERLVAHSTKSGSEKRGLLEKGGLFRKVHFLETLVALYCAMRLRFGYGFESCDANGPRNVKNTYLAKHRPVFLPPLFLVGSKELVLKVPKRGQFHAAIRVTIWRCDSCAQGALGKWTVSRWNFCDAESLAKRCGETYH